MTANRSPATDLSLLITAASATVSLAYAVQAVLTSAEVTAQYAAARSAALSLAVGAVIMRPAWRTRQVIVGLGLTMSAVQLLDAGIGFGQRDLVKTLGPPPPQSRVSVAPWPPAEPAATPERRNKPALSLVISDSCADPPQRQPDNRLVARSGRTDRDRRHVDDVAVDIMAGSRLAMMTPSTGGGARPDNGGDVYLTDAGVKHWESMLDTLDIASDRWIDCPVLSAVHIQYGPDGSGSADVQLQLIEPPQIIQVLDHQFPAGHIDRVDLDNATGLG